MRHRLLDALARHVLTEEDDIGLEHAVAGFAGRNTEHAEVAPVQVRIAIGRGARGQAGPCGIRVDEPDLERRARRAHPAMEAGDAIQPPMQVDHRPAACGLVQAVDVLGQQHLA